MTMTGLGNNLTTQWTFRDGREYSFSLTTTESPNTVSFWIADKITGEEWTGCFDENGIEVLTKRTGCFKSFKTFLAMIKSAILKKSESVVLDLLNIDDLAAISFQRQCLSTDGGSIPPNFQLYDREIHGKSIAGGGGASINRNPKPQELSVGNKITNDKSSVSKRKYLIVTYIGEFDKVHYPLPLNYSNPPDLSVMQNNIIQLKTEVTSLRHAKIELESELKSMKSGTGDAPQSQEKTFNEFQRKPSTQEGNEINAMVQRDLISDVHERAECAYGADTDKTASTCKICSSKITALQSTIRDMENAICCQKEEYLQAMEKLENEVHFLQHKVEAAEKYELELWNQIQMLKEKVTRGQRAGLDKELSKLGRKDSSKNRSHQSRHDLYYDSNMHTKPPTPPTYKCLRVPMKCSDNFGVDSRSKPNKLTRSSSKTSDIQMSGFPSRSNSATSFASDKTFSKDYYYREGDVSKPCRSRSSSYHSLQLKHEQNDRRTSISPAKSRFDPTAYVVEKKQKLSRIANLRLQKIESRIKDGARSRISDQSGRITPVEIDLKFKTRRSSSSTSLKGRLTSHNDIYYQSANETGDTETLSSRPSLVKSDFKSMKRIHHNRRPFSATTVTTNILPHEHQNYVHDIHLVKLKPATSANLSENSVRAKKHEPQHIPERNVSEFNPYKPPIKSAFRKTANKSLKSTGSKTIVANTRWEVESPVLAGTWDDMNVNEPGKHLESKQNCDISFLQNKLSALQNFLETCKSENKGP